jgi:hypothetical protein
MFELSVVFQVNRDAGRSPCVTSVQTLVWHGSRTAPRGCRAVFSSHVQNRHANPHGLRFLDRPKPSLDDTGFGAPGNRQDKKANLLPALARIRSISTVVAKAVG